MDYAVETVRREICQLSGEKKRLGKVPWKAFIMVKGIQNLDSKEFTGSFDNNSEKELPFYGLGLGCFSIILLLSFLLGRPALYKKVLKRVYVFYY